MANQKVIDKKSTIVEEIKDRFNDNATLIIFDYNGLTDKDAKKIKRLLKEEGGDYKIYKNTLIKRAVDDLEIDIDESLVGPSAIAYGTDQLAPIKVIYNLAKENKKIQVKTGIIDGEVKTLEILKKLSTMPNRDHVMAMLAAGLFGPVRELAICLDLYAKQKEEGGK